MSLTSPDQVWLASLRARVLQGEPVPLDHEGHLRLAHGLLGERSLEPAIEETSRLLQRLLASHRASQGLSECDPGPRFEASLTWAWVALVAARRQAGEGFDAFLERNPDIASGATRVVIGAL